MTRFTMEGEGQQIAVSVPLFLRKLWKMVNDQEAEDIIGWNSTGDGFVIFDQLQFITKLLPKYFKHNNMASFIRQLNFYDFHKVAGIDKDEIQFTHSCFLKDLPETLVFIRRKCTSLRSKILNDVKEEELLEILGGVKDLKTKHALVDNELKMLKEENGALWNEVNNLRIKHAKQTKIINKIIHFLISYMHTQQNSLAKGTVSVGKRNSQNLKTGPTILEIGYHNNPNVMQNEVNKKSYTVTDSGSSGAISAITYPSKRIEGVSNMQPAEHTLDEILNKVGTYIDTKKSTHLPRTQAAGSSMANTLENVEPNMLVDVKSKISNNSGVENNPSQDLQSSVFQNTKGGLSLYNATYRKRQTPVKYNILHNPKEHLGLYLNDTQVELNSLQDMLNNLNSTELINFCNLIDSDMDSPKERNIKTDLISICQEANESVLYDDDLLVEELANLPVEPNSITEGSADAENEQQFTESLQDMESEVTPEEYLTI